MKEYSVSQPTTISAVIPISYQPSVDGLMTEWLADRVKRAIEMTIEYASAATVRVRSISVFGFESYEEPTRAIFINPEIEATDDDAYEYWGMLAEAFAVLNRQPHPPDAKNTDVRIEILVGW